MSIYFGHKDLPYDLGYSDKGDNKNMIPKFSNFLGTHVMVENVQIIEKQVNSFKKQYQILALG